MAHRNRHDVARHRRLWLIKAPLGLALVGTGVSIVGHATLLKAAVADAGWIVWGTLGLIVLNAGLAVFGDAVKDRALLEWYRARDAGAEPSGSSAVVPLDGAVDTQERA